MKVLVSTKLSPHKYKTPEGYLYCQDAIIARTGKQTYMKSELYPGEDSNELIEVDRPEEEVCNPKTIASFEDKPITVEHPDVNVGPENYNELAVGHSKNVRKGSEKVDGETVLLADLIITDAQTIDDIENEIRTDLSCGYDCDITEGPNPKQINIRGNHIALCEQGRAGCARIIDNAVVMDMAFAGMPQVKDLKSGYAIVTASRWAKYGLNAICERTLQSLEQARIDCASLIKHDEMDFVIVDGKTKTLIKDSINDSIKNGDYVDFGTDGKFYVCDSNYRDDYYWVTDNEEDRLNTKAKGWTIAKSKAKSFAIKDALSKGVLIQEFGKNGAQYKIEKIEKNTIYATDIYSDRITLFRKDKQGIDWDIINKTDVHDSISYGKIEVSTDDLYKYLGNPIDSDMLENKYHVNFSWDTDSHQKPYGERLPRVWYIYGLVDNLKKLKEDYNILESITLVPVKDAMSNLDEIVNDVKSKLEGVDYLKINKTFANVEVYFENTYQLNKATNILKETYDISRNKEKKVLSINDKLKVSTQDSVRNILIKDDKTSIGSYSRKFYLRALDRLQRKLDILEKNQTLDENNFEHEKQKNSYREMLKYQIEQYKNKIADIDKGE